MIDKSKKASISKLVAVEIAVAVEICQSERFSNSLRRIETAQWTVSGREDWSLETGICCEDSSVRRQTSELQCLRKNSAMEIFEVHIIDTPERWRPLSTSAPLNIVTPILTVVRWAGGMLEAFFCTC